MAFWEAIRSLLLMLFAMPLGHAVRDAAAGGQVHRLAARVAVHPLRDAAGWLLIQERWNRGGLSAFCRLLPPFVPSLVEVRLKRELAQRRAYHDSPLR